MPTCANEAVPDYVLSKEHWLLPESVFPTVGRLVVLKQGTAKRHREQEVVLLSLYM